MSDHLAANLGFLDELVAWRRALHLEPGSPGDRCAAYLIRSDFEEGGLDWREASRQTREALAGKARGELTLASLALERLLEHTAQEVQTPEIRARADTERETLRLYCEALQSGAPVALHGISDEHLPDWYFLASPRNPWFRATWPEDAAHRN